MVGAVDEETIKHNIETQRWGEGDQGFRIAVGRLEPQDDLQS